MCENCVIAICIITLKKISLNIDSPASVNARRLKSLKSHRYSLEPSIVFEDSKNDKKRETDANRAKRCDEIA